MSAQQAGRRARLRVRLAEGLGARPGFEGGAALPGRVRDVASRARRRAAGRSARSPAPRRGGSRAARQCASNSAPRAGSTWKWFIVMKTAMAIDSHAERRARVRRRQRSLPRPRGAAPGAAASPEPDRIHQLGHRGDVGLRPGDLGRQPQTVRRTCGGAGSVSIKLVARDRASLGRPSPEREAKLRFWTLRLAVEPLHARRDRRRSTRSPRRGS